MQCMSSLRYRLKNGTDNENTSRYKQTPFSTYEIPDRITKNGTEKGTGGLALKVKCDSDGVDVHPA